MAQEDNYKTLADAHGWAHSERYVKILQFLMTPRQAEIVVLLPMETGDIARQLNRDEEEVKGDLDLLFRKGVVYPKDLKSRLGYRFAKAVNQLHDGTESLLGMEDFYSKEELTELFTLWEDYMMNDLYPYRLKLLPKLEHSSGRVVPAYRTIKDDPNMQPWEDFTEALKLRDRIGIMSCSCRARKIGLGTGCESTHDANCFNFGRAMDYSLERGNGKVVSYDEALQIFFEAEEGGCVLMGPSHQALAAGNTACVCCPDCCIYIEPVHIYGRDNYPVQVRTARSRWDPEFNLAACTGCQDCVGRCPYAAITMQKVAGHKRMKAIVNLEHCMGCGQCVLACEKQANAVKMKCVRPADFVPAAPLISARSWDMNVPRNWGLDPTVAKV